MSRTFSNFLLFEDVLDGLSTDAPPIMKQAVSILKKPIVKVVSPDCRTLLGQIVDTSSEAEGKVEVATDLPLTQTRIRQLLSQGKYQIGIRKLHTCLSHLDGGICQACYKGSFLGEQTPSVGTIVAIDSSFIYQTDILVGDNYTSKFTLSQTSDDYEFVKIFNQGVLVDPAHYTLGYDFVQFEVKIPLDSVTGVYTVHFYSKSTEPFQGYISKTYSGAVLGMEPLPTAPMLLRKSLYEAQFSDGFIALMMEILKEVQGIPPTYLDYIERIHSRLEKVLVILYLYSIYSNVNV